MRWLLQLYPRVWRERYEEEMMEVLTQHKQSAATVFDLILGAIDANLNYEGSAEGVTFMMNRHRSGMVMVFCAFVLFGLGWSLLQRITDPLNLFQPVAESHPDLTIFHEVIFICGCLAFLALIISGMPILFIAVKRLLKNNQRMALRPLWIAVLCLLIFTFLTGILADWPHIAIVRSHMYPFLISYFISFLILLTIGTVCISLVLSKAEFKRSEFKLIVIPEIVIVFSMVISVLISTLFIVSLTVQAPELFSTQDVGSGMFVTGILLMALATIFGLMGLKRSRTREMDLFERDH